MRIALYCSMLIALCAPLTTLSAPPAPPTTAKAALSSESLSSRRLNEEGIIALRQRDYAIAEEKFKKSLDMDEHNLTAVYNLSGVLVSAQRSSEAIKLLSKYITLAPSDAGLHARLGDAYFATKEIAKAVSSYKSALSIDPDYLKLYEKLGTCLTLQNRTVDAEKAFARAHQAFPNDPTILSNLAVVQLRNGHTQLAIQSAESSINLRPSTEAYSTLSAAQNKLGNKEAAATAYKKSKALAEGKKAK